MKKSRFSDSQILSILKRAENGVPVPELCREHGMSSASFYKWRAKFGGMDASMMARLKELEDENRRLKKMYAEERLKTNNLDTHSKALYAQGMEIFVNPTTQPGITAKSAWPPCGISRERLAAGSSEQQRPCKGPTCPMTFLIATVSSSRKNGSTMAMPLSSILQRLS